MKNIISLIFIICVCTSCSNTKKTAQNVGVPIKVDSISDQAASNTILQNLNVAQASAVGSTQKKEAVTITRNQQSNYDKIIFNDTINNVVTKTLALHEINPFYKTFGISGETGAVTQQLVNATVGDYIDDQQNPEYLRQIPKTTPVKYVTLIDEINIELSGYVLVANSAYLGADDENVGLMSQILIYTSSGELVKKLEFKNTNVLNLTLARNNELLCYSYGCVDEFGWLLYSGYILYDLKEDKQIYKKTYTEEEGITSVYVSNTTGLLSIGLTQGAINKMIIYDFKHNKIYSKDLTNAELGNITKIDSEAYYFNESGKTVRKPYSECFTTRELSYE